MSNSSQMELTKWDKGRMLRDIAECLLKSPRKPSWQYKLCFSTSQKGILAESHSDFLHKRDAWHGGIDVPNNKASERNKQTKERCSFQNDVL